MSKFYAQLDENKKCVGVSQLSGPVESPFLVEIDSLDNELLGMTFKAAVLPAPEAAEAKAARIAAAASARSARGWS